MRTVSRRSLDKLFIIGTIHSLLTCRMHVESVILVVRNEQIRCNSNTQTR